LDLSAYAANLNLDAAELEGLCAGLPLRRASGGNVAFVEERWFALREAVVAALREEHEKSPESPGLNAAQLRLRAAPRLERAAFAELLEDLRLAGELARESSWWFLPGHTVTLTAEDEALWLRLAPYLAAEPFQPPRVRDLARAESLPEAGVRTLLFLAARAGRVHRVAHDHFFGRDAVAALAAIVRDLAAADPVGAVRAAEFRDRIGTGRKLAIQILEFFDRAGLTRRVRDEHRLREGGAEF
jgi:selenocysteine-specific elongation factor